MTKQPKELDVNITAMRQEAWTTCLAALRTVMKRMDDLDTLERLLNESSPRGRAAVAAEVDEDASPVVRRQPLKPKRKPQLHTPRHVMRAIQTAAMQILAKRPGATLSLEEITTRLLSNGQLHQLRGDKKHLQNVVRRALDKERRQRTVIAVAPTTTERRTGQSTTYRLPVAVAARSKGVSVKTAKKAKAARHTAAPFVKHGNRHNRLRVQARDGISVKDEVKNVLIATDSDGLTPKQITDALLAKGLPATRGKNPLQQHVNWALKALTDQRLAAKRGQGPRSVYSVTRPRVTVTKEDQPPS